MGLEPITVELNDFLKLELVRDEDERLSDELAQAEKDIRDVMLEDARYQYLASLSPYYASRSEGAIDPAKLQELNSKRELVAATLEIVRGHRAQLEASLGAPERKPAARGAKSGSKSSGFDSFDNFRQARG
jgi:hypothetical protein